MYNKVKDNAHRLASTLERYTEDECAIKQISNALNYYAQQLKEDMKDIAMYLSELEHSKKQ